MKSLLLLILPVVLGNDPDGVCKINERILGGEPAEKGEFPGVVYIVKYYTSAGYFTFDASCAGSLVNDYWVLTAAHCLFVVPENRLKYYNVYPAKGSSSFIPSTEGMLHAEYNPKDSSNDIGLIRLPRSMSTIDPYFKTVSLPVQGQRLTSNEITYVGWGATSTTDSTVDSPYLKKLEHVPLNQSLCSAIGYDESKTLCFFPTITTGTACSGDSGGPIFMDGLQVGIVSREGMIENGTYHSIMRIDTRVSAYINWINITIRSRLAALETSQ
ncbi:cationic trypsin-3-like isoform X1 [Anabrus simplex]|uniref:cationic trypsin-3-like isoform X1 n=1 Tax=Anabrus simplex TaxID=316456 RepID=UPI0035A3A26C